MATKRKSYVWSVTSTWWKRLPFYHLYMLHEDTAVLVVWFSIELIFGLFALKNNPEVRTGFVGFLQDPVVVTINLITLAAVLLHIRTQPGLTPETANIIVKGEKVKLEPIIEGLWAVTVTATIVVLFVALYW